jgi:hypothetical protein
MHMADNASDEARRHIGIWRAKAEELCTITDGTTSDDTRRLLLNAAANYDRLADEAEGRRGQPKRAFLGPFRPASIPPQTATPGGGLGARPNKCGWCFSVTPMVGDDVGEVGLRSRKIDPSTRRPLIWRNTPQSSININQFN